MDIFVARQPIFNCQRQVIGYELLFRDGFKNAFPDIDGAVATSNVLSNTFFSFPLAEILNGKKGFINFPESLLLDKVPLLFSHLPLVIEILEDVNPDMAVISGVREFKKNGLTIALDDFVPDPSLCPLVEVADILKFDILATPLEELEQTIKEIVSKGDVTLLAEKVETHEEFFLARKMGFTLFQGYFFSKPEILKTKDIHPEKVSRINLINEVAKSEINRVEVECLIKADVSISFKLLKFINSAYFNRPNPLDSLRDAVTFLGTDELRKFISIIVLSGLCEEKPHELLRQSVIRGRMCERCSTLIHTQFSSEELFTLGLFSLLDAILNRHLEDIFKTLSLSKKMRRALLGDDKDFNRIIHLVVCFEKGQWTDHNFSLIHGTRFEKHLSKFYYDSLRMADQVC